MKMKAILLILITNISVFAYSQNYQFDWAKQIGGVNNDAAVDVETDQAGNSYILGYFSDTIDLDPNAGIFEVSSKGENDMFIVKLTAGGDFVWAKSFGGTEADNPVNLSLDSNGNVYFSGIFRNVVDFDPGTSTFNLTSSGWSDIFFTKLDTNGNLVWAKQLGNGSSLEYVSSMDIDANYLYLNGGYDLNMDFDPNAGTTVLNGDNSNLYVAKYDLDGNLVWAKAIGNSNVNLFFSTGISVDPNGNVYSAGYFSGTIDFDPSTGVSNLTSVDSYDSYILKMDGNGTMTWVKQISGTNVQRIYSISAGSDYVYAGGEIFDLTDFDPGSGVANMSGMMGFACKLTMDGNFEWVQSVGNSVNSLIADAQDDVYCVGYQSVSGNDNVVLRNFSSSGNTNWDKSYGGSEFNFGFCIHLSQSQELYVAGRFGSMVDFNTESGIFNLTSNGSNDGSILKLKIDDLGLEESENSFFATIYPNPSSEGVFTISTDVLYEQLYVTVYTLDGKVIMKKELSNTQTFSLDMDETDGTYLVEITTDGGLKATCRIVKK